MMGETRQLDAQSACDAKLVERLALGFEAVPWGTQELLELDEVGSWLGGLDVAEVRALCATGLLASASDRVSSAEVLRFLESYRQWFAWRGARQVEYLRAEVDRAGMVDERVA